MTYDENKLLVHKEDPVSSGIFLKQIFEKFKIDNTAPQHVISMSWKEIVGINLAESSCLASIKDGTVNIKCKNGSCAALLRMNSKEICKKVNSMFPELNAKKVVVSVSQMRGKCVD